MARSIINQDPEACYLCGCYLRYRESHHIFGGPNRKLSEKYGLKVYLCHRCHQDHREGVHHNPEKMKYLHEKGQQAFEEAYSHERFMEVFGKNYIEKPKVVPAQEKTGLSGII